MQQLSESAIKKKVRELGVTQEWNHQYYLPFGIRTRGTDVNSSGYNLNKWKRLRPILDEVINQESLSILDVGCSDGYYSIELAKSYSRLNVEGVDLDPVRIDRCNFIKDIFQVENCKFSVTDLYDLIESDAKYDIVMGLGLLHRVPDLEGCINDLCSLAKHFVVFEFKTIKTKKSAFVNMGGETKSNKLNGLYKMPSIKYVSDAISMHGFKIHTILEDKSSLKYPRTIIVGKK